MSLRDFLPLSRGDEGSTLTVVVRQPNSKTPRTIEMTRSPIERDTVSSTDINADDIGYVGIDEIGGSTVSELRKFEQKFRSRGFRGLVIDFTIVRRSSLHYGILLADALLDSGTIGRIQHPNNLQTIHATGDSLFRGFHVAVLVEATTNGVPEWIAAALQDNKRAIIVGHTTAGVGYVNEPIRVPDSDLAVVLSIAVMQRADGRPIQRDARQRMANARLHVRPRTFPSTVTAPRVPGGVQPDELVRRSGARVFTPGQPVYRRETLETAIAILRKRLQQGKKEQTPAKEESEQRE